MKAPDMDKSVLGHFAANVRRNAELTTVELGKIDNSLRNLQSEDIAVITVCTNSRDEEDGTVKVDIDPKAVPALKQARSRTELETFFRYLLSLGY